MTTMTRAAFARHLGVDRAHITRLAQSGRLVLAGEGRGSRVKVAESEALIAQTAGSRDDVARRHAETRAPMAPGSPALAIGNPALAANGGQGAANAPAPVPTFAPTPENPLAGLIAANTSVPAAQGFGGGLAMTERETATHARLLAESRRVIAAADTAEMERDRLASKLIDVESVEVAMKHVGAAARGAMENFADQVAPLMVPCQTVDEARAVLEVQCRNFLVTFVAMCEQQREALQRGGA